MENVRAKMCKNSSPTFNTKLAEFLFGCHKQYSSYIWRVARVHSYPFEKLTQSIFIALLKHSKQYNDLSRLAEMITLALKYS